MTRLAIAAALAATFCACEREGSPVMMPGENCMMCHGGSGEDEAPRWTVAGTLFATPRSAADQGVRGVDLTVTDAHGRSVTLTTNAAGNFYSAESLVAPFSVSVQGRTGPDHLNVPAPSGACNSCHTLPPAGGAPGRLSTGG